MKPRTPSAIICSISCLGETHLGEQRLGLAHVGADPLRPPRRINPRSRYAAMQDHLQATGQAAPGAAMMCSTAALQVNLQAGPASAWRARVGLAHQLGPDARRAVGVLAVARRA